MKRIGLLAAAIFVLGAGATANAQQTATPSKGEYLARAGDCIACYSVRGGRAFAGGLRLRLGVAKDGHHLFPAIPVRSDTRLCRPTRS
jgi:hypothetical protein